MKNLHSLQSFTLHRIVFHGNQSLLKLRDFEMNYFLLFLAFYCTNLSLVATSLVFYSISTKTNYVLYSYVSIATKNQMSLQNTESLIEAGDGWPSEPPSCWGPGLGSAGLLWEALVERWAG